MSTIKNMEIKYFKGIKFADENFDDAVTLISGKNGAGKTSTLEAIRYALTGKVKGNILTNGKESGYVKVTFNDPDETTVSREFFAEKPTKVKVNGKNTTAKSAQELICSLLDTNEQYLDMNTSQDVFREMLKGELGKFLLSFVPESFTPEKLFELVDFSDEEAAELTVKLPETFGLDETEGLYKELYEQRASLKVLAQRTENQLPDFEPEEPSRTAEDVEKELAELLASEQIIKADERAIAAYNTALAGYNKRAADIKAAEEEIASIIVEEVDPLEKEEIKKKQQQAMSDKATAQGNVITLKNNIAMFKKTLVNLGTNVCPISERLVCTTDKTAAKAEFEQLIADNEKAIENQNTIIATADIILKDLLEKEAEISRKEKVIERKNNLTVNLAKAKAALGECPVKPEVKVIDVSKKDELKAKLLKEKEDIFRYKEYLKTKEAYDKYCKELSVIDSLTKKFAPKGVVTESVIGFYCEIFNEEIEPLASAIGYEVTFIPQKGLSCLVRPGKDKAPVLFEHLSTGEQLIAVVIIQHLCNLLSGSNIMLIDNFNDLDENNAAKFRDVLEELTTEYALLVVAGTNI